MPKAFAPVSQEHSMGCAVACVASRCGCTYLKALELFTHPQHAWTRGFYCKEIVAAFEQAGFEYSYATFNLSKHKVLLRRRGTIVFLPRGKMYPEGHFFLRTKEGWMNPWSNFPNIDQQSGIESRVQEELPGSPTYVIFELI